MKKIGIAIASFGLPLLALAQGTAATVHEGYLTSMLMAIKGLLNTALPIIIAAAVVYFVYGIARYVMSGDEAAKEAAKGKIIYGIIGLFVMVSVWGLVNILSNIFGVERAGAVPTNNLLPTN